jgi:hypothetical protein
MCLIDNLARKQGVLLEQESKEAGLASPCNPQRSASSNKPQISEAGSHSKADKQAAVSQPKKHAVSQISKPQRSRLVNKQGRFLIFRRRHPQFIHPRWFCHALSLLVALSVLYFD